jgi:hypothetical protein
MQGSPSSCLCAAGVASERSSVDGMEYKYQSSDAGTSLKPYRLLELLPARVSRSSELSLGSAPRLAVRMWRVMRDHGDGILGTKIGRVVTNFLLTES